jgi:Ca-activated chloride channel family protein
VEIDPANAQRVNLVLNAGTIRMTATAQRGTAMTGSLLTISRPESSPGGVTTSRPGEVVLVSNALQSEIALTPGPYVVSISHGLFRTDRQIMVVAGTRGRLGITLPTGEIELQAVAGGGGPPLADVVFQVFEDDPDAPQGRRELMRSAAARPSFNLPAGTYYVVARQGPAEARERLTVRPGEVERRTLTISSAQLSLAATIAGGRPDSSDSIVYRIERIDAGSPSEVMRVARQTETLNLAPGRYRVESRLGSLNARAERTIDLRSGTPENLTLDHQAGVVRLTFVEAGSAQHAADVFWEIKDQSGQTVWLTSEPQPLGILRAGRYTVRAQYRDRVVDGRIDVQAGDNRVVELIAR